MDRWIKSEREPHGGRWGGLIITTYKRSDGKWAVGNSVGTIGERREWFVNVHSRHNSYISTAQFRKRFATPGAAMRAVDKRFPMQDPWPDCPACRGVGFVMATTHPSGPLERYNCSCPKRPK